jgi:uncharacterized protein (DUF427 family)
VDRSKDRKQGMQVKSGRQNKEDSLSIVRIDERNQRVFIVVDSTVLTDIEKLRVIVEDVDRKHKFRDDLNITFVQDAEYAGYKDELEATKGISYSEFYHHYLGEYNKKTKVFWTYPALQDKKVKFIIE